MSPPPFEWFKWYSQTNGGISYQGIKQRNMRHGGGDEAVDGRVSSLVRSQRRTYFHVGGWVVS